MTQFNRVKKYFWNRQQLFFTDSASLAAGTSPPLLGHPETPDKALERLLEGNERLVRGVSLAVKRNLERPKVIVTKQTPFAVILGCSDFPISMETVFDQECGDLFVAQVAGNIATNQIIGSLEYGTQLLGAKVLFILGHTGCGTVGAMMMGEELPGQFSDLHKYICPAIKTSNGDFNVAVRENVRNQAALIAETSPVISKLLQHKELIMAGGVYDLETGVVEPVENIV